MLRIHRSVNTNVDRKVKPLDSSFACSFITVLPVLSGTPKAFSNFMASSGGNESSRFRNDVAGAKIISPDEGLYRDSLQSSNCAYSTRGRFPEAIRNNSSEVTNTVQVNSCVKKYFYE